MENIIHLEFFEEMPSALKHIHLAYSAIGGALYENYTTSKFKYLFGCVIVFQYIVATSALILGIIPQQEQNARCSMLLFYIYTLVANALAVYWKRDIFHALFDQMKELKDGEFVKPNFNFNADHIDEINLGNWNMKGFKFNLTHWLMIAVIQSLQKLVIYMCTGEFAIDYQRDYICPIAFFESQSLICYIFVHMIVSLVMLFFPIFMYGSTFLPLILSIHLRNHTIRLQNDMTYHTALTFKCMEECDRREERILNESPKCERVRNFQLRDIQKQRDRHIEEFMHKVRQWIKYHQKLISCASLFKKCVPHLLGLYVVVCCTGITGPGCLAAKIILDSKEYSYDCFFHIALHSVSLMAACAIAHVIPEMSDDISAAIYSMPWYYLPVKDQKVLLQFLTSAQDSPKLRIFRVFSLSLEKFPELMNKAYGYIQLIRVLEMKIN